MQFLWLQILSILFSVVSQTHIKQKLCINCKFFIADNTNGNKYSKCSAFIKNDYNYLVTGIIENPHDAFYYCSTARQEHDLCGINASMYKRKYTFLHPFNKKQ